MSPGSLPSWAEAFRGRLEPIPDAFGAERPRTGDFAQSEWPLTVREKLSHAAVLVGLRETKDGLSVVLTERAGHLKNHAGQVAFPGGRADPGDASPLATALREAHEEIALSSQWVRPLGAFEDYETGSGYHIHPIVAAIDPGAVFRADPGEVSAVFEAPLAVVLDPARWERRRVFWRGADRHFWTMDYGPFQIWGATAAMLRHLSDRVWPLLAEGASPVSHASGPAHGEDGETDGHGR